MSTIPPPTHYPPQPPQPPQPHQPEGRSVSFYVAIFLALLLLVSGGVNLILIFFAALSGGAGIRSAAIDDEAGYRTVVVGGMADAESRILRVPINGPISESYSPFMGAMGGTVSQLRRALKLASRDDSIRAVLIDINSPGGGVTDSEEIHRLISEFRQKKPDKPVLALFGDMSASGAYYIAAACSKIMARPTTITGSIGVIISSYNFAEAMKKVGVKSETIISPSTPYKDILSPTKEMKDDERQILLSIVEEMYQRFVDIVDRGRPELTREQVIAIANGQVYSAKQAQANGLVDSIGSLDDAYAELRSMMQVSEAEVIEQRKLPSLMEAMFGSPGVKAPSLEESLGRLLQQTSGSKVLYFWPGGR